MIIDQIARGTKDHEKMLLCLCHIGNYSYKYKYRT